MKSLPRIVLGAILIIIGAALVITAFMPSAGAATPLPEWAVDTPPAASDSPTTWSAGCFIRIKEGVALTISRHGTIQLPFGRAKDGDQTPQETAARETLEEIGVPVKVHELVAVLASEPQLVKGEKSQSLLYRCTVSGYISYEDLDTSEIAEILIINPVTMRTPDGKEVMAPWRFPTDRDVLMYLFQGGL